jgi:hypothetical protein
MNKKHLIVFALGVIFSAMLPGLTQAATPECDPNSRFGCFEVGLPGSDISAGQDIENFIGQSNRAPLLRLIRIIVTFITALIVSIGIITVVVAGYIYMTAGGDAGRVGLAKQFLSAALLGIFLALTSYLILNTISPQFTREVQEPTFNPPQ